MKKQRSSLIQLLTRYTKNKSNSKPKLIHQRKNMRVSTHVTSSFPQSTREGREKWKPAKFLLKRANNQFWILIFKEDARVNFLVRSRRRVRRAFRSQPAQPERKVRFIKPIRTTRVAWILQGFSNVAKINSTNFRVKRLTSQNQCAEIPAQNLTFLWQIVRRNSFKWHSSQLEALWVSVKGTKSSTRAILTWNQLT